LKLDGFFDESNDTPWVISLRSETTNKLTYIYMNSRILDRFEGLEAFESIKAKSVHDLTPEEEVMMENVLLGIDVDDQGVGMDIEMSTDEREDEDVDDDEVDEEDEDEF
jgi:hypothetical protein